MNITIRCTIITNTLKNVMFTIFFRLLGLTMCHFNKHIININFSAPYSTVLRSFISSESALFLVSNSTATKLYTMFQISDII